jgi:hypothetical protein
MTLRPPHLLAPRAATSPADALEYELLQEKAAALGRLARNFEVALAALVAFDAAPPEMAGKRLAARREQLLDAAGEALWCLVVQREACGLRNTEAMLREYPVPAAVRLRMGITRGR